MEIFQTEFYSTKCQYRDNVEHKDVPFLLVSNSVELKTGVLPKQALVKNNEKMSLQRAVFLIVGHGGLLLFLI